MLRTNPAGARLLETELDKLETRPPYEGEFVWRVFCDLAADRDAFVGVSGASPKRISFRDMAAWCSVHHASLCFWETEAIREIDDLYLKMQPQKQSK